MDGPSTEGVTHADQETVVITDLEEAKVIDSLSDFSGKYLPSIDDINFDELHNNQAD